MVHKREAIAVSGTLMPWRSILMPDAGRICLASYRDIADKDLSAYEYNHGLFRLDASGRGVWQVRRDERGALDLEVMQTRATELGIDGGFLSGDEPFLGLTLLYAEGTSNFSNETYSYPSIDVWVPGCTVRATSLNGHGYVIDIETGIATNITARGLRPW